MSTQILTELPNIQKAGMDFNSVISEIKNIIRDNPNWKENWSEFYDSEAGVMLTQLMAWIADNMSTRQDLLYNEMFLGTAQKDIDKVRHLKQIGYIPQMPHSARAKIKITLNKMANEDVIVSVANPKENNNLSGRVAQLATFESKDINGRSCYWEIIKLRNGKPDYLGGIYLSSGNTEYWNDSEGDELYAVQGKTVYEEFVSDTENGSCFNLREKDIAANSLRVYLKVGGTVQELTLVNSFVSKEALDESKESSIPYVLELNEDLSYKIRFASVGLLKDSKLLPANSTLCVFYRVSNGSLGNIKAGSINKDTNYLDVKGENYSVNIYNEYPGTEGSNKESLNDAVMNGPISLRTMDRAVTPEDYNVILKRNTSIFKAKTYTASNQPKGFRNYYGRFINPQESFSFVMLNKDHDNIPTSKFNSFPWITTVREPRMNERYIFDKAEYNHIVDVSPTHYNITVNREGGKKEYFRNLTVLNLGNEFNSSLYETNESGNYIIDENGNYKENAQLKAKLTTSKTDKAFFKDIPFSIFSGKDMSVIKMKENEFDDDGKDVNLIMDDNARFITRQTFDSDKPINVINYRYFNFVLNEEIKVEVDLLAEMTTEKSLPSYYLKWYNVGAEEGVKYGDDPSVEAAEHRNGIIQLINKSIADVVSNGEAFNFANGSYQYFGFKNIIDPNDEKIIPSMEKMEKDLPIIVEIKGITYKLVFKPNFRPTTSEGEAVLSKPGSLQYLCDYLNYAFRNGYTGTVEEYNKEEYKIKKIKDADWTDIDIGELIDYKSEVRQRIVFDTDYYDDNPSSSGIVKMNYDISISSSEEKCLDKFEYKDKYGYSHTLEQAVNIQDPSNNIAGTSGLFQMALSTPYVWNRVANAAMHILPEPSQKANYNSNNIAYMSGPSKQQRLCIVSPTKGLSSTIYLEKSKSDQGDFAKDFLKVYFDDIYSYKAYGVKKIHLLKKDPLSLHTIYNGKEETLNLDVHKGNLLFENSCIYTEPDFSILYSSYTLKSNDSLEIGSSYDNFYYVGGNDDNILKENNKVVGLLGQSMNYTIKDNGLKEYDLDLDRSQFNIKFTKEPQDTNSIFAINDDLGVVGMGQVNITSYDIKKPSEPISKLIFSIDDEQAINVNIGSCNNAIDIIRSIKNTIKNGNASMSKLKENMNTIVSSPFESINQITFKNLRNNSDTGNIKFFADSDETYTNNLYKMLFGTNITNTDFYKLYPPNIVPSKNIVYIKGNHYDDLDPEYYYSPAIGAGNELTFKFRKLVENKDGSFTSRSADYYIDVERKKENGINKYSYYLKKIEDSLFPDSYFYLHFVNDKTYDFIDTNNNIRETEESVLQNYMNKYKISGTDIVFIQPYFKTYDIAASIRYNINFNKTEVSKNVKLAIDSICDLQHSDIAGSISKAKIFKAIMNCDGVEDCRITYLGYDYENKPTESYEELNANFYEVICIHEDDNISNLHGKILTFDESGNEAESSIKE